MVNKYTMFVTLILLSGCASKPVFVFGATTVILAFMIFGLGLTYGSIALYNWIKLKINNFRNKT